MTFVFEFEEYYCLCDNFLFNSGDLVSITNFFNERYFWVKPERSGYELFYGRVVLRPTHFLKCSNCFRSIGIVVFPYDRRREILRFNNNRIISKKCVLIKENGIFKLL